MSEARYALLDRRALLSIAGADARAFLQGLVSNDVEKVGPARAVHAALLTAQGKFLHDFCIAEEGGRLLLDGEAARQDDLFRRLRLYRLRAKAEIAREDGLAVAVAFGVGAADALGLPPEPGCAAAFAGGVAFVDPRLAALGARAFLPREGAAAALEAAGLAPAGAADWDRLRMGQGVPDGSLDIEVEKATLLDNNFEELNGVDYAKGCYVGQEVTARMHYRGLSRKRLLPVSVEGPAPEPGTPVTADGKEVGEMRSVLDGGGLALFKLESIAHARPPFLAGGAKVTPRRPDWAGW